jgi:tetratricopeptide (TPR) repeat protein
MVAYDLYLRARESFFQNNCENAVHLLEEAIARDPEFIFARFSLAQMQLFIYRYNDTSPARLTQAREAVEAAVRSAPDLPPSRLAKAQYCYYGLRDYKQALRELTAATLPGIDPAEFHDLAALCERRLGQWRDAIRDGEQAVALDPRNPFVVSGLINSYIAVRRFSDAIQLADKAIEAMISQDGYILGLKSQALLNMGRIEEATAVLENSPSGISRLYQIATNQLFARNFTRASELLGNATPAEKENYAIPLLHGMVARADGNAATARAFFQIAHDRLVLKLRERANDPEVLGSLAVANAALGHKEEALNQAMRAAELCPISSDAVDGPTYRLLLAEVYAWNNQVNEACLELANIIKVPQGPSYGELRFNPAWDGIRTDPRFAALLNEASSPPISN